MIWVGSWEEEMESLAYFGILVIPRTTFSIKNSANTNFGLVNVKDRLYPGSVFSVPIISAVDTTGEKFLMVGCERGWVYQYRINPDGLPQRCF
jgi:hypothetical protein